MTMPFNASSKRGTVRGGGMMDGGLGRWTWLRIANVLFVFDVIFILVRTDSIGQYAVNVLLKRLDGCIDGLMSIPDVRFR